ncbi:hypothetical protein BU646_11350 [Staphylococcus chromogenes]|nr:hypothetical protein BU647_10760 [Staphylococcus chromogenes]PTG11479.1 hypothetical protein BU646_11350 [Staphylococcus chromogenes]
MEQNKFEQSKVFMIVNFITFIFIAWLLTKIPFVNRHEIMGTFFYVLMLIIFAVIIYKVNYKIYIGIKNKK